MGFRCTRPKGSSTIYVRDGRDDEIYRVTEKEDGHYVACDHHGNGVGDNIALVRELEPGLAFADAVYRLYGSPGVTVERPMAPKAKTSKEPLVLPVQESSSDQVRGRKYLEGRGIDLQTVKAAEKDGYLAYTGKAILFVARDAAGQPKGATRRTTESDAKIPKYDVKGTDKSYPGLLRGTSGVVLIVDGGVDALAAHARASRRGAPPPTVIVTGGVGQRSWLQRPHMREVLCGAGRVVIARDNEKNEEVQATSDAHIEILKERVRTITGAEPAVWTAPIEVGKDLADLNVYELAQAKQRKAEEERIEAECAATNSKNKAAIALQQKREKQERQEQERQEQDRGPSLGR